MRKYELVLVTKASISETLRKKVVASVKSLLKDLKIAKEKEVGQKALAYGIGKEKEGFYFDFALEGESIPSGFEKRLLENENIIRHLILRTK